MREFLLQKVQLLGKPKTNFQILQQNVLLKYKYFVEFLQCAGPPPPPPPHLHREWGRGVAVADAAGGGGE